MSIDWSAHASVLQSVGLSLQKCLRMFFALLHSPIQILCVTFFPHSLGSQLACDVNADVMNPALFRDTPLFTLWFRGFDRCRHFQT